MSSLVGNAAIRALFTALSLLLSWRLWRFTIRPRLHPQEPKELPYWIPCVYKSVTKILYRSNFLTVVGK
jgi:hypothetical protein